MQTSQVRKIGRRNRKANRVNWVQSLFFVLVSIGAGYLFLQSNFFAINTVQVSGNKVMTTEEVKELAGVPLGANIFKVDLGQVENKIQVNPMIKKVVVERAFPSTVEISLEERSAIGLIPVHAKYLLVDVEGYCIGQIDNTKLNDYPMITGLKVDKVSPGQNFNSENVKSAVNYLDFIRRRHGLLQGKISEINVADDNDIKIYTIDNVEVRLGNDQKVEDKLNLLNAFMSQKYDKRVEYVDVSYDSTKLTTKFVEQEEKN